MHKCLRGRGLELWGCDLMYSFLRVACVSLALAFIAAPSWAFTLTFDENGNCTGCGAGTFVYGADPTGAYGGNVLAYILPSLVISGTVGINDPDGRPSDAISFTNANGVLDGGTNADRMIFYSFDNEGLLADVGTILASLIDFPYIITERADGTFTYDVGNVYNGLSGDSTTPIPAALPLFAGGLGVIGLLARRRKRRQAV